MKDILSFLVIIAACFCNPSIKLTENGACSEKGIANSIISVICRTIRESCDSPREVTPKKVCNSGLRCVILKTDHLYRCATQDDIEDMGEEFDPELIINGHYDEVKISLLAIFVIILVISMISIYVYKLHQKLLEKANKNLVIG
jgi:hypothetical protein